MPVEAHSSSNCISDRYHDHVYFLAGPTDKGEREGERERDSRPVKYYP